MSLVKRRGITIDFMRHTMRAHARINLCADYNFSVGRRGLKRGVLV